MIPITFKNLLLSTIYAMVTISQQLMASEINQDFEIVQQRGTKISHQKATLKNFKTTGYFESPYFRIVESTHGNPVSWNTPDPTTLLRAATVYYHLHKARDFYLSIGINHPHMHQQHIVRINIDRQFSSQGHFKNDIFAEYNGARTIPSTEEVRSDRYSIFESRYNYTWNNEVWFFKPKEVKVLNSLRPASVFVNSREFKSLAAGNLLLFDLVAMTRAWSTQGLDLLSLEYHLSSMALTVLTVETVPLLFKLFTKKPSTFFEDAALMPSVVYHEYGHIALSPYFSNKNSSHLSEGYPNFFAGLLLGISAIGQGNRNSARGTSTKKARRRVLYSLSEEYLEQAAYGDYVYGLLWDLHQGLGDTGLEVIKQSLKYLNLESNLRSDFPLAIRRAIHAVSKNPQVDIIKAAVILEKRGL